MQVGKISKLFRDKEYGKIRVKSGEEAHFHKGCLWNIRFMDLVEGQDIEFEMEPSNKGQLAFHIRPTFKNSSL